MRAGEIIDEWRDVSADNVPAVLGTDFEGGGIGDDEFSAVIGLYVVDPKLLWNVSDSNISVFMGG